MDDEIKALVAILLGGTMMIGLLVGGALWYDWKKTNLLLTAAESGRITVNFNIREE